MLFTGLSRHLGQRGGTEVSGCGNLPLFFLPSLPYVFFLSVCRVLPRHVQIHCLSAGPSYMHNTLWHSAERQCPHCPGLAHQAILDIHRVAPGVSCRFSVILSSCHSCCRRMLSAPTVPHWSFPSASHHHHRAPAISRSTPASTGTTKKVCSRRAASEVPSTCCT